MGEYEIRANGKRATIETNGDGEIVGASKYAIALIGKDITDVVSRIASQRGRIRRMETHEQARLPAMQEAAPRWGRYGKAKLLYERQSQTR